MTEIDHAQSDFRHWLTRSWIYIAIGLVFPEHIGACTAFAIGLIAVGLFMRMNSSIFYNYGQKR